MQTSRVLINDNSVSITSRIANIMNESFCDWCESVFDTIANEINNQFELKFVSNPIECEIMKYYGLRHPDCLQVRTEDPSIVMPIAVRFQSLIQALPSVAEKMIFPVKRNVCIHYSCSMLEGIVTSMIERYKSITSQLPEKLGFIFEVGKCVQSVGDISNDSINILLVSTQEEYDFYMSLLSDNTSETYVIFHDDCELTFSLPVQRYDYFFI